MVGSSMNREKKAMCRSVWLRRQRAKSKHYGLRASSAIRRDSPSQNSDMSEVADTALPVLELDKFPEDILHHIHSLVPLRDAARAACVSHRFLQSWRRFPNLAFNWETFGLNMNKGTRDEGAKKLVDGIHHILGNHSGNGLKTLKLPVRACGTFITANNIDIWLQAAIKSGIVELDLDLPQDHGPKRLHMIEIFAPKITTFVFNGPPMKILTSNSSQIQSITMNGVGYCGVFQYALTKLYSIASNLQALTLLSSGEVLNMPSSTEKFLHLRHLKIHCSGIRFQSFDFLCLVSFLEACPVLETFMLSAGQSFIARQDSVLKVSNAKPLELKRIPEFHHGTLKKVTITGFCSSMSLIELTRQILVNCSSLQCLVIDTTSGYNNSGICQSMDRNAVMKALEGVEAIKRYIKGNVPSIVVNFEVLEPCGRCHISNL